MPQDPFDRVQVFLSETRVNPLALLLDLTTLLPESLLQRAIWLAQNANESVLQAFLVRALAKRLPTRIERTELTKHYPVPRGTLIKEVSIPEGKRAKRLITKLSEEQRYEVFDQLLVTVETACGAVEEKMVERPSDDTFRIRERRSGGVTDVGGEAAAIGPLDDEVFELEDGGGFEAVDDGFESAGGAESESEDGGGGEFEAVDEGFEAVPVDEGFESMPGPAEPPSPSPQSATTDETGEQRDIVNLGFAHNDAADNTLKPNEPLQTGHSYYFWLNIGRKHKDAIGEATRIDLQKLPEEAVLTVAIFSFENEIAITPGQDIGELKVQKNGTVKVLRQPTDKQAVPLSAGAAADYLDDFLLFPISVPHNEAVHRLRCNIYCAQVLVQSYVVSADVKTKPDPVPEPCTKKLDYVLSESLRASHLAAMTKEPHLLSLMLNDNGNGSHNFRFLGADGTDLFKDDAQIDGPEISGFLREARQAMHKVSWGKVVPWDPNDDTLVYRYQSKTFDRKKLAKDLAFLARAGWAIFNGFAQHLKTTIEDLQALMANPGLVQIALKLSPRVVVPAAVIYDYNWSPDTYDFATTEFQLCPTFSAAIDKASIGGPALEECDCFKGKCAFKAMIDETTKDPDKMLGDLPPMVCPSGFWGYRHSLGLPLTLDGTHKDMPPVITYKNELQMVACVSTDPLFIERDPHLGRLKLLKQALKFERDESLKAIIKRLKTTAPHLLYFYCHGGIRANNERPYLEIGASDRLGPESLSAEKIKWAEPNPLVFINGCHTTSLNPEISLNFVSAFVQQSGAAGVIGTEITIFEPLAAKFAEECFARFVGAPPHNESMPIGKAVRGARLELLRQGNPLGLVYIPYAVASLRLQQAPQN